MLRSTIFFASLLYNVCESIWTQVYSSNSYSDVYTAQTDEGKRRRRRMNKKQEIHPHAHISTVSVMNRFTLALYTCACAAYVRNTHERVCVCVCDWSERCERQMKCQNAVLTGINSCGCPFFPCLRFSGWLLRYKTISSVRLVHAVSTVVKCNRTILLQNLNLLRKQQLKKKTQLFWL